MDNKDLIGKIKKLGKIQPSQAWLDLTRHNLVAQIEFETAQAKPAKFGFGFFNWLKQPQLAALTICLMLIFVGGPWLTFKASQASLPGELLYSVKRAGEGLQTTISSEESRTQLQVEFASRRLEELTKINQDFFAPEEKNEKVKQVVDDLKNNLAGASVYTDKISKEKALVVAKKAKKIKEDLTKTKEEASADIQGDLAEAEKVIDEINQRILTSLVEESQQAAGGTATTSDEEILIFLEQLEDGEMTTTDKVINGAKE